MKSKQTNEILYKFLNEYDVPIRALNSEDQIIYMNKKMIVLFGNLLGEPSDVIYTNIQSKEKQNKKPDKRKKVTQVYIGEALYSIASTPLEINEKKYIIEVFKDITEEKRIEARLRNNYNNLLRETKFARGIQKSVLPIDDKYWNMIQIDSVYVPAEELGGDMFDIVKLNEDEVLLYMADVAGHGLKASLLTIFLREVVRGRAYIANEGLDSLISSLIKYYNQLDIDAEMYLSILCCKYNKKTNELCIANAGHNCYPLILRKNGRIEEVPIKGMPISKISIFSDHTEEIVGIYPGDRILMYTDGIIEEYSAEKETEFGVAGVRMIAYKNYDLDGKELGKKIMNEASRHSGTTAKDDKTIMVATIL